MTRLLAMTFAVAISGIASAQTQPTPQSDSPGGYGALKLGAVVPQHKDLRGFDTGFSLEAAVGYRLSDYIALEGGIGYFKMTGSQSDVSSGILINVDADVSAISVSASLKAIAPLGKLELFALVGPGMYFVSSRGTGTVAGFPPVTVSDSNNAFGFHFGGGASVSVAPQMRLGAEVRYIIASIKIFDENNGMDSFIAQGTLAFRF